MHGLPIKGVGVDSQSRQVAEEVVGNSLSLLTGSHNSSASFVSTAQAYTVPSIKTTQSTAPKLDWPASKTA